MIHPRRGWAAAFLLSAALACSASADDPVRRETVRFAKGATAATLHGTVRGYGTADYTLRAKAGQTMTVTMKTTNLASYFNVLPPGSDAAIGRGDLTDNAWTGVLPVDGEYRVQVYLMRSAARRNETARYTLTVGVADAPPGDAKVPGTQYHATGTVPCSFASDPKGSSRCSFGVVRGAAGTATVYLASPGFDAVLHRDAIENVLVFSGGKVRSERPGDNVSAIRDGDSAWFVTVNGTRFYTIPDAVLTGG
ncbi:MAG: hypothetical protein JSR21_20745 [Proteobacteria bacterium]|nr:hypothetical protein [Pseudomonadota bacterium]